jgi:hypothetical protein
MMERYSKNEVTNPNEESDEERLRDIIANSSDDDRSSDTHS